MSISGDTVIVPYLDDVPDLDVRPVDGPQELLGGDEADDPTVLGHGEAMELGVDELLSGLLDGEVRRYGNDLLTM